MVAASHDDGIEAVDVTDPYNPVPKGRVGDTTGAVELDGATGVDTFSIGNRHYVVVASSDDHGRPDSGDGSPDRRRRGRQGHTGPHGPNPPGWFGIHRIIW